MTSDNNFYYNKDLKSKARRLRSEMTKAEASLWKYALRGKMRSGFSFRRQRPVLAYIADFMCKELMLIIEVDGITHTWETTVKKDLERESNLRKVGFHILRFDDDEVLNNMDNVIFAIDAKIEELKKGKP